MNFRKTYGEFLNENLNEKKGDSYSKGCAMIFFDFPDQKEIHDMIDPAHLYTEEGDRSYGLEDEPHITLLYGLNHDVKPEDVFEAISGIKIPKIKLVEVTAFKNENFDVLKWDVDAPFLYGMNEELVKLPHENDFPDYHPHATIAYLKPGMADKYIKEMVGANYVVQPTHVVYSLPNGNQVQRNINNMVTRRMIR